MPKRILLIGGNFSPEPTGIGKYNGEMIQWLASKGYECTVITTQPYYPYWKVQLPYSNRWFVKEQIETRGKPITVYRCPQYVPGNPSGKKRLLQETSFATTALFAVLRIATKKRFDVVITVVPPIQLGLHAWLYKKLRGAKFLYHIQDLQVEAARDLQMIRSGSLLKALFGFEKFILGQTDMVSTISPGMIRRVEAKIKKEVSYLPNWVDLENFFPLRTTPLLKQMFGFSPETRIVLYSGAIGEKQGLELVLEAASVYKQQKDIVFLVCGSGPYKEKLEETVAERELSNIRFFPLQPQEHFNGFLNMADVHLVIQKKGASDLVMPSKLTTILAVGGLAIVSATEDSSLYETVAQHQMGILVEPENPTAFCEALDKALQEDHSCTRQNAREYAEEFLAIDKVLSRYTEHLN